MQEEIITPRRTTSFSQGDSRVAVWWRKVRYFRFFRGSWHECNELVRVSLFDERTVKTEYMKANARQAGQLYRWYNNKLLKGTKS